MANWAGGAEFVSAVKVEDVLDVVADDGVEGEVFWSGRRDAG